MKMISWQYVPSCARYLCSTGTVKSPGRWHAWNIPAGLAVRIATGHEVSHTPMIMNNMIGTRHLNGKITPDKHTGKDENQAKSGNLFIGHYSGPGDNDCLLTTCFTANAHSFASNFTADQNSTGIHDYAINFANSNIYSYPN